MSNLLAKVVQREGSGPLSVVRYVDGAKVDVATEHETPAEALQDIAVFLGVEDQVTILNAEGEALSAPEDEPAAPEEELDEEAEDSEEEEIEEEEDLDDSDEEDEDPEDEEDLEEEDED